MICRLDSARPLSEPVVDLLTGPLSTNFSEILIEIYKFSLKKNAFEYIVCEMAVILSRPQCINLTT